MIHCYTVKQYLIEQYNLRKLFKKFLNFPNKVEHVYCVITGLKETDDICIYILQHLIDDYLIVSPCMYIIT